MKRAYNILRQNLLKTWCTYMHFKRKFFKSAKAPQIIKVTEMQYG